MTITITINDHNHHCVQVAALCVQLQRQQSVFEGRVEAARKESKQVRRCHLIKMMKMMMVIVVVIVIVMVMVIVIVIIINPILDLESGYEETEEGGQGGSGGEPGEARAGVEEVGGGEGEGD